jgi:multicomponent Na+:H+ antiporter subunit F
MIEPWIPAVLALVVLIALALVRLASGPTAPDRVVALDVVNTLTIAAMILLAIAYGEVIFVDVADRKSTRLNSGTLYIAKYLGGDLP